MKKPRPPAWGADDWLDKFFCNADGFLCSGAWCGHERCKEHDNRYPYYCKAGCLPSKCNLWKAWRLAWRSYPEKEQCQKCKYYKPEKKHDYITNLQLKKVNEYKCYCRAKELPENCPKKTNVKKEAKNG